MKHLVTGANGLVGAHVVLELMRQGKAVVAGHRAGADLSEAKAFFKRWDGQEGALFNKVNWIELDILDIPNLELAIKEVSVVYHCAGFVSFEHRDRAKMMQINVQGTGNVVNACLLSGVTLCHVSSVAVFHNLDYKGVLDESVYWKTSGKESDYAVSKYGAEREVWRGIEEGLKAVIVNPAVILANGFWKRSSSRVLETIYKGNPFYTGGNTAYVAASDVARIMVELVDKEIFSERFILAENTYSYKSLFSMMAKALGKREPSILLPKWFLMMAARFEKLLAWIRSKPARVTPDLVNSAYNTQTYTSAKIIEKLQYKFKSTPLLIEEAARFYLIDHQK